MEENIILYCCGRNGIRTYLELKEVGIEIECFGDSFPEKCGYVIDNKYCLSLEQILKKSKNDIIVVTKKNPEKLVEFFQAKGFKNVISQEDVYRLWNIHFPFMRNKKVENESIVKNTKHKLERYILGHDQDMDEAMQVLPEFEKMK